MDDWDSRVRDEMFVHLDRLLINGPDEALRSSEINTFTVDGVALPLILQTGVPQLVGIFEGAL